MQQILLTTIALFLFAGCVDQVQKDLHGIQWYLDKEYPAYDSCIDFNCEGCRASDIADICKVPLGINSYTIEEYKSLINAKAYDRLSGDPWVDAILNRMYRYIANFPEDTRFDELRTYAYSEDIVHRLGLNL